MTVTMGSYGVGVTRAVAALAEQTLDDKGLCWPRSVAPADVHLVATGRDNSPYDAAEALAADLESARGSRAVRRPPRRLAGVKFKDAELLGVPTIVVVGRGLARGLIELRDRRTGRRRDVPLAAAAADIQATVARDIPSRGQKEAETSTG